MLNSNIFYCDFQEIISKINELETSSILLVVDENILQLYEDQFEEFKSKLHPKKKIITWTCIYGETTKTIPEYERCVEYFLQEGVNRNSHLIAWGGGATSDFAGFVAATILRGINWSVIPTTLLSIIDASIGGKVAVNTRSGKNLIGAFHLPENIWIDQSFISTLPKGEITSGQGELIKYLLLSEQIYKKFKDVNQLHGGIIDYKHQCEAEDLDIKFKGKNFVFDERLGEKITDDILSKCHQCGAPCDDHTNCFNDDCHLLFIQCKDCKEKLDNCCGTTCQAIITLPIEEQRKLRRNKTKSDNLAVYKSRLRPKLNV